MRALDPSEGLRDLEGAVSFLSSRPFVAKDQKMGAIGWCMGGMYARLLSQASDSIGPTVICYGSVATEPDQIARLRTKPVLGIFGKTDRGIPEAKVLQFAKELENAGGKNVTIKIYDDAGHGFMRPGGPQYHAASADDAWKKIERFLETHLKK
jgi:carboxymethylenebutenolidase